MSKFLAGERLLRTQDATDSVEKTDLDADPDSSNRCPPDSNYHHRQAKKLGQDPLRKTPRKEGCRSPRER